jgi:hypothetical protein
LAVLAVFYLKEWFEKSVYMVDTSGSGPVLWRRDTSHALDVHPALCG